MIDAYQCLAMVAQTCWNSISSYGRVGFGLDKDQAYGVWIKSQLSPRTHLEMLGRVMRIRGLLVTPQVRLADRGCRGSFQRTVSPEPIP
jgi:hypothetical protein